MITTGIYARTMVTDADEIWVVTRSFRGYPVTGTPTFYVPELAPSPALFSKYMNLRNIGQWNQETFNNIYIPQFIAELSDDALQKLYEAQRNKTICLACYCKDKNLCHCSILSSMIKEMEDKVNV